MSATAVPTGRPSDVPVSSMPCPELSVDDFLTTHAPSLEHAWVGLENPSAGPDGWFGHESLDRYAPGQAAAVLAAVRGAAQRCASYGDVLAAGGPATANTVSTAGADVPADDVLVLRVSSTLPDDPEPYVTETAFVREGDVVLTVGEVVAQRPAPGVEAVLPAAVAAYRAAGAPS